MMPTFSARQAILGAAFVLAAAVGGARATGAVVIHDARGRDIMIGEPTRIVSVGGAITEILYALGLQDRIVGVDTTSIYPPSALAEKPNVGYMRQLSAEGVLGLNPQLILAVEGSGPKETLDVLDAAKIPLVSVPEGYSEQGPVDKIRLVAHALHADERGACLAAAVEHDIAELRKLRATITTPKRVIFIISFVNGRALVAGGKTAADEVIRLAGAVNAIEGFDGYKPVSDEAVVAAKPDVILTMGRGKDSLDAETVLGNPAFRMTPAGASKSFISMDALYLLGFGPRTPAAARDLAVALYPDAAARATWQPAALTVDCHK